MTPQPTTRSVAGHGGAEHSSQPGPLGAELLELLASDAPAEELISAAAQSEGRAQDHKSTLASALRVREVLDDRQRQAKQLRALFDTASDLSALRDLGPALRAICNRAKTLLKTSAAWINLTDPAKHDTYIHTTEGVQAEGGLRIPPGAGLAGLVAAAGAPRWTSDYKNDNRLVHYEEGDAWTQHEGIKSALGVPLKRAGVVLGVVMTAEHGTREFTAADAMLLQSFADHAAIAIENARLFTEAQQALAGLSKANHEARMRNDAIEASAAFHERLTELVLEGADLQGVLDAVIYSLGGSLIMVDPQWRVVAQAGSHQDSLDAELAPGSSVPQDVLSGALEGSLAGASRGTVVRFHRGSIPRLVLPIPPRSHPVGALVLTRHELTADVQRLLERAALVIAVLTLNAQAVCEAELRNHGEVFRDLFSPNSTADASLLSRTAQIGLTLDDEHTIVLAHGTTGPTRSLRMRATQLVAKVGGFVGEIDTDLVFLLPGVASQEAAGLVGSQLGGHEPPMTITGSRPAWGQLGLSAAYAEARQAARVLTALGRVGTVATSAELGMYGLLMQSASHGDAHRFIEASIGPLLAYDKEHQGSLVDTLTAYFEHGGHVAETAIAMFVHVNTIYARLEKVSCLLPAWKDNDGRLQTHLAIRIHQLDQRLQSLEQRDCRA